MMDYENVYNLRIAWSVWVAESGNKYLTEYHLRQIAKLYQIPWKTASYVLRSLCESGDMICKDECWELSERCRTEIMAAQYLACCSQRVLSSFKCSHQIRLDGNIFLSCEQMHAIQFAVNNKISIITGSAGTGKTTVIRGLCKLFPRNRVLLCAPTGKAVSILREKTGFCANTIDHYRCLTRGFTMETFELVIVDEASLMNTDHLSYLLRSIGRNTRLVLVGDVGQLPSVNGGEVLLNLMQLQIPLFQLTEIFRQKIKDSALMHNLMQCLASAFETHLEIDASFQLRCGDKSALVDEVIDLIDAGEEVQVLTAKRDDVEALNGLIVKGLYEESICLRTVINGVTLWDNEAIMITENNWDLGLANGEVITVSVTYDTYGNDLHASIITRTGKKISDFTNIKFAPAYAMTVHKSQGGEFDTVVLYLPDCYTDPYSFWNRNLLYTALSRAKKRVIVYGSEAMLLKMMRTPRSMKMGQLQKYYAYFVRRQNNRCA